MTDFFLNSKKPLQVQLEIQFFSNKLILIINCQQPLSELLHHQNLCYVVILMKDEWEPKRSSIFITYLFDFCFFVYHIFF